MNLCGRTSAAMMAVGGLVAWADIDSDRMATTTFGVVVLAAGAVGYSLSCALRWVAERSKSLATGNGAGSADAYPGTAWRLVEPEV